MQALVVILALLISGILAIITVRLSDWIYDELSKKNRRDELREKTEQQKD